MTVLTFHRPETTVSRKISKVKLHKGGGLEVEYEQTITIPQEEGEPLELNGEVPYKGRNLPHPDMMDALKMLRSHLALICDLPEAKNLDFHELEDLPENLEKLHVTGFSIGGNGDHEGVTLIGYKILGSGKVLNLVAPFTKYQDENGGYNYAIELQGTIDHAASEALEYLDGKIAPSAQGEFEFPEGNDDDDDIPM